MTKDDLKRLFKRNPDLARYNPAVCALLAAVSQCGAPNEMVAMEKRKKQGDKRPVIRFTFCRVRLLDADGYRGGEKDLLDGLQKAGLIFDDTEKDIDLKPAQQSKVSKKREEGTIIEIEL